jgi:hypothetical protein
MIENAVLMLRDSVTALIADAQPGDPPEWWLESNRVNPVLEPPMEVPETLRELYRHLEDIRGGFLRAPFPPPDADPQAVDLVREISIERAHASKRNEYARERAHFETCLMWRAYYAVRLSRTVELALHDGGV